MTGWTSSGPVFMVVNPESFACPASPDRGYVFDYCTTGYYGIGRAGTESISQTIDISNLASDISSGLVNINLSAYAIKWLSASDATIKLELLNGSDTVLDTYSQSVTTGSCWQALTIDQNSIDPDTTTLRITLSATISNESPAIDYIEFDGVSLILTKSESEINI
ncbi:hypothetical protein SDC9_168526 [bioreactor metagenome]|uniref:MAM domain-containing protein n=1 Tax=bioreactor metagenome TaxID=1076179 RepID=A0A645G2Q6_9ZZZZ